MLRYWAIEACVMLSWHLCLRYHIHMYLLCSGYYVIFIVLHYLFHGCFVKLVLSNIFGCMVCRSIYTRTYPIYFVSAPSPLHFRSVSVVSNIRIRIRNRSLSDLNPSRKYGIGYGNGKIRSDTIRLHPYSLWTFVRLDGGVTK